MKRIAVLMTVFNRKKQTLLCLDNLFLQELPESYALDVFLTDDGCTDGTPQAIKEKYPTVNIVGGDGILFWNRGMWAAWDEASKRDYDYYLWLNDDTALYPFAIKELINISNENNRNAIIVGLCEDSNRTKFTYGGRVKGKIPPASGKFVKVDYFNGNIVLIPSSVYRVLGNLDPYFTHSKGDFDYGMRAMNEGIEMFQTGMPLGICDSHPSLDKWCNPEFSLKERWKAMWMPNGMPPHETFHLEKRHIGVITASFHYVTIIIRCLFPKLWIKK